MCVDALQYSQTFLLLDVNSLDLLRLLFFVTWILLLLLFLVCQVNACLARQCTSVKIFSLWWLRSTASQWSRICTSIDFFWWCISEVVWIRESIVFAPKSINPRNWGFKLVACQLIFSISHDSCWFIECSDCSIVAVNHRNEPLSSFTHFALCPPCPCWTRGGWPWWWTMTLENFVPERCMLSLLFLFFFFLFFFSDFCGNHLCIFLFLIPWWDVLENFFCTTRWWTGKLGLVAFDHL